ncbi:MAG: FAD-dependent oxidoreductase [Bacteriovoracaceae bacterium]
MPQAKLIQRQKINETTHLLTFKAIEELKFIGGQFIIIDSGLKNEEGKPYKRTYSLLSEDSNTTEFQIAYKVLEKGIVTNQYLNQLKEDDIITFSGPWGKFLKDENYFGQGDIFVLATDTAVASALSFVNSQNIKEKNKISFYWMVPDNDYFLSFDLVKKRLPQDLKHFEIISAPEFGSSQRSQLVEMAKDLTKKHQGARTILLAGDGKIVNECREYLVDNGVSENHIGMEVYFNKDRV